jgi:hypothetical protein
MRKAQVYAMCASAAAALALAAPVQAATRITGTVSSSAISLKAQTGAGYVAVKTLPAGKYTVVIRDRSKRENFHLSGPGVDGKTTRAFAGTTRWTLRLRKGLYTFRSDAHPLRLKGRFRVV